MTFKTHFLYNVTQFVSLTFLAGFNDQSFDLVLQNVNRKIL